MKRTISILIALFLLVSGCVTDDEDGAKNAYTVSGRIIDAQFYGIEKVTVFLTGEDTNGATVSMQVNTNTMGSFSFESVKNGSYTITPSKTSYGFYPSSRYIKVKDSNLSTELFTGYGLDGGSGGNDKEGFTVSGAVLNSFGKGVVNIRVAISGGETGIVTRTDGNGEYRFTNIKNGSYRVVPSDDRYRFDPSYVSIFVRNNPVIVDTFTALPADSGQVDEEDESVGTHTYFPIAKGTSRTMKVIESDYLRGNYDEFNRTYLADKTVDARGRKYRQVIDDNENVSRYRVEGETVYTFAQDLMGLNHLSLNDDSSDDTEPTPLDEEIPYLVFGLAQGGSYTIIDYSTQNFGGYFTWKWTGTYYGDETVETVAGSFANCRKYSLLLDSYAVSGGSSARDMTQVILWLSPGIGPVRVEEKRSSNNNLTYERTEELVGYSKP